MDSSYDLKKVYQAILNKKMIKTDQTLEPEAEVVSLSHFFNTHLKKLANETNLPDRVIQRFFSYWSGQQFAPLKDLLRTHPSNEEAAKRLVEDFEKMGVSRETAYQIINPTQVEFLRTAAFTKVHIVEEEVLRDFIHRLLVTRGNLTSSVVQDLLDSDSLNLIRESITHPSLGEKNYEVWETLGDGFAKGALRFYLARRFPKVLTDKRSSSKLTEAGKNYESNAFFPKLFDALKMEIIASYRHEVVRQHPRRTVGKKHGEYLINWLNTGMKEDMMESLFGVLHYVIDLRMGMGIGNAVCYNIFSSLYDEFELTLDESVLKDAVSKLKEVMEKSPYYIVKGDQKSERMDNYNMKPDMYLKYMEKGTGENYGLVRFNLWLYLVPGGLLKRKISQPLKLTIPSDFKATPDMAKQDAAAKALDKLRDEYGITWEGLRGFDKGSD